MKPLLLTMTQNREEHISQMVKNIYPTFEGIVGLVNLPSNDNTLKILEENKGNGRILTQNFTPNHAFLMNHLLFYGNIKDGQWCLYLDSPESCTDLFIQKIPDFIKEFESVGVSALYWDNRPYLFKYSPYLEFFGAVHWGLKGLSGQIVTLPDKDKYIINRRKDTPKYFGSINGTKYYLCYPLGNDIDLVYSKFGNEIREHHETLRRIFRRYCIGELKLNLNTLSDMIEYMKKIHTKEIPAPDYFVDMLEIEFRLSELFQIEVLGMDFMKEVVPHRYKWSFKKYLETGDGFSDPNYKGTIIEYQERFNIKEG